MRILTSIVLTAGLVASLAACTAAPAPDDTVSDACAVTPSGSTSDSIEVSDNVGSVPTVTVPTPLSVEQTERTVVVAGDGAVAEPGSTVRIKFEIYNGTSGDALTGSDWSDTALAEFPLDPAQIINGIVSTLQCTTEGSRVVSAVSPADGFADVGSETLGVAANESFVIVADLVEVVPPLAPAVWTENVPEVTFGDDGTPEVTLASDVPETALLRAVLEEGDGAVVEADSSVTLRYQGTNAATGEVFDQNFGSDTVEPFNASGFVPGFSASIIGQKVGSTLVISIPPANGYGEAGESEHPLAGQTMVFVITIEAVA